MQIIVSTSNLDCRNKETNKAMFTLHPISFLLVEAKNSHLQHVLALRQLAINLHLSFLMV
jgi:hypothetical protein